MRNRSERLLRAGRRSQAQDRIEALLRERGRMSVAEFLESCYRTESDDRRWARALCHALGDIAPGSISVAAYPYAVTPDQRISVPWLAFDDRTRPLIEKYGGPMKFVRAVNTQPWGPRVADAVFAPAQSTVAVVSELPSSIRERICDALPWPSCDSLGMLARLTQGRGMLLGWLTAERLSLSDRHRRTLMVLCEHLSAAHALRELAQGEGAIERRTAAILSEDGRLRDADVDAGRKEVARCLSDAIRRRDRARVRRRKHSEQEATELWGAFVGGQYTLVESVDRGGQRSILAVRLRAGPRALTRREATVVRHASQGWSNKQIAGALGLAVSTVAVHVAAAMKKLGCSRRSELMVIAAGRTHDDLAGSAGEPSKVAPGDFAGRPSRR